MKVKNIILGLLSFSLLALSSCEKTFDQLEKDSNRAVQVPASLVLQAVEYNVMNDNGRPFSAEMRWNQFYCSNYNYYANNEYTLGQMPNQYTTLKNVIQMETEAKKAGLADVNGYSALGKFFRAYFFAGMPYVTRSLVPIFFYRLQIYLSKPHMIFFNNVLYIDAILLQN